MKVSIIILCLSFGVSVTAMESEFQIAPSEITFYNTTTNWAQEQERDWQRDNLVEQTIASMGRETNLNSNDNCSGGFSLFGKTSILFDVSDDDNLVGVAHSLMQAGASPNFATSTGHTPFERAIRSNAVQIAWKMLGYKADCKRGLLVLMDHACLTTDNKLFLAQEALAKKMLEALDKQKVSISKIADNYGQNLLMKITQIKLKKSGPLHMPEHFRVLFAGTLLKYKADAQDQDFFGESAIDKARNNKLSQLQLALEGKLPTSDLV